MMKLPNRYRQLLVSVMMVPLLLVASCGVSDDPSAAESTPVTQPGTTAPDVSDVEADTDEQVVCNLISDEEISEATGFEVVSADGSTMGLPMCEWELLVPESAEVGGFPLLAIVLLPESDYRSRVDPLGDTLEDIDGPGDEVKFRYVGGDDSGIPASMTFLALKGNEGFQIMPGFAMWDDEATAKSALLDLANKMFDRI